VSTPEITQLQSLVLLLQSRVTDVSTLSGITQPQSPGLYYSRAERELLDVST
jgi:hypothetical protein